MIRYYQAQDSALRGDVLKLAEIDNCRNSIVAEVGILYGARNLLIHFRWFKNNQKQVENVA